MQIVIAESSNRRWSRGRGWLPNGLVVAALFSLGTVCHAVTLNNYFNFINIGTTNGVTNGVGGSLTISDHFGTNATVKTAGTTLNASGLSIAAGNDCGTTGVLVPVEAISDFVTAGASLAPGASIGTLTINNNLTLAGDLAIEVNTSVAPSNDLCHVTGTATCTGSGKSVIVTNLGPALVAGDTFKLFSGTLANGQNMTITVGGAGVVWTNELATLGQIWVLSVAPTVPTEPTNLMFSYSANTLTLSWPSNYVGWILQSQTNSRSVGLATNWFDVPGSSSVTATNFPVSPASPTVFYRLRNP